MTHADPDNLQIDSFTEHSMHRRDALLKLPAGGGDDCNSYGRPLPSVVVAYLGNRQRHSVSEVGDERLKNPPLGLERPGFRNTDFDPQCCGMHSAQVRATSRTS